MGEPFFCLDDWKNNPMKWVFENSWASFCSCPFPKCYKTFLVHQRAWTCRYIPPFLLCSFATYLLHHLQCLEISGKVQHVSTLNESLSNCQRPEHLRWVSFQGFLAEGHSIFQTSLRYSRFKTIYRTDITPNKNWGRLGTRRKLRENLQKLSKDLGDAWGQWLKAEDGAPDDSKFPGEKKPRANEFLKRFLIFYLFANW